MSADVAETTLLLDEIDALRAEVAALRECDEELRRSRRGLMSTVDEMREALIWCSGSDDFQEGGKAREGWLKVSHLLNEVDDG